jgi:hypothetical protein
MRRGLVVALASLAALAACNKRPAQAPRTPAPPNAPPTAGGTAPVSPAALPERTPGLWEQKVTAAGRTQVSRICLDRAVEQRFTVWGQHAGAGPCRPRITPHAGGGWEFASACDMGERGKTETRGVVTGDFSKSYRVTATSSISGAPADMNGTHDMTLEASWQGPCPADVRPGDMLLPGGLKINMLQTAPP